MLRIYLTDSGVEGYREGCGCCSSKSQASVNDIDVLVNELSFQIKELTELKFLIKKYGESNLVSWIKQSEEIKHFRDAIIAAEEYSENPNKEGTYYKKSFDNWSTNIEHLSVAENIFSKVPTRFKKYIGYK